ncbi:hypothetical protein [Desertivirga xinjiangensis]|uniref:hypothetical protein n=1 Tax=Desertivirga xinjiangensis TaxID=539206 RepID=UPI00210DBAF3|nr:hypothetical protein [Pedobacter xinjiangensis]
METKIYSSSGFAHHCSAEELYVLTRHWLSDLHFFAEEINYFLSLGCHQAFSSLDKQSVLNIEIIRNEFKEMLQQKERLEDCIIVHQTAISHSLDNNGRNKGKFNNFNILQSKLEGELFDFIKKLRQVKLRFFEATKKAYINKSHDKVVA